MNSIHQSKEFNEMKQFSVNLEKGRQKKFVHEW